MKKYIIALITVILTTTISCDVENLLEIPQKGVVEVDMTYENADDNTVLSLMAGIYYQLYGSPLDGFASYNNVTGVASMRNYFARMGGELANYWLYNESAESTKPFRVYWSYSYTIIYGCNLIIEKLPNNVVASSEVINRAIAEARAIRAIQMTYLVQLYGNPPLADHIMNGTEGNTPAAESWAFIESELAQAAEELPSKDGIDGQASIGGRLTKEAAYAYLGRAYLWQEKYSEAASILYNKVISTGLYALIDNYEDLNSLSSNFCSEYLWEYEISDDPTYVTSQTGSLIPAFNNWNLTTQYPPDGYYTGQGYGDYAYPSESFGDFMDEHDVTNANKSARYRATIATYEDMLDPNVFSYENSDGKKGMSSSESGCEGYFRIKGIPRTENILSAGSFWYSDILINDWCFMRYSEVLLNYAEAVAMGGNAGALSGLDALNHVRQRAGLTDAPALDMDNEEYGVKAERRAELFYESTRYIDLVRWGDAATVLADVGKIEPVFYGYEDGSTSAPQSKEYWKIQYNQAIGVGFKSNKNELFPIPLVEINNNPNLIQNPGW